MKIVERIEEVHRCMLTDKMLDYVESLLRNGYYIYSVVATSPETDVKVDDFLANGEELELIEYIKHDYLVKSSIIQIVLKKHGADEYVIVDAETGKITSHVKLPGERPWVFGKR